MFQDGDSWLRQSIIIIVYCSPEGNPFGFLFYLTTHSNYCRSRAKATFKKDDFFRFNIVFLVFSFYICNNKHLNKSVMEKNLLFKTPAEAKRYCEENNLVMPSGLSYINDAMAV